MNKEENKKINYLKELTEYKLFLDNILIKDKTARQILVTAYNKLKRQQKEIEELKKICDSYKNASDNCAEIFSDTIKPNYISKDKIRETIKHYNNELEHIKNGEEFENEKPMYYWR